MAAVKLVGGDGCAWQENGEKAREGERPWGEWEEREGDVGVGVALVDASRASAEAGGGRRVAAGTGQAPLVLLARGGGRLAGASGLGRAGGLGGLRQVKPCSLSLFLFFHLFYYFCNFRALLKMPGHFQKS